MRPIHITVLVLTLHPVAELLVLGGEILFELAFVATPVRFELLLGPLHIPIDGLGLDAPDRLSLYEVRLFVACGPRHSTAQLRSSVAQADCAHSLQDALELASFVGYTPSHQVLQFGHL